MPYSAKDYLIELLKKGWPVLVFFAALGLCWILKLTE